MRNLTVMFVTAVCFLFLLVGLPISPYNQSFFLDCFHMRGGVGGVPHLGGLPGQPYRVTRLGGVSFLHVNAEGGVG